MTSPQPPSDPFHRNRVQTNVTENTALRIALIVFIVGALPVIALLVYLNLKPTAAENASDQQPAAVPQPANKPIPVSKRPAPS